MGITALVLPTVRTVESWTATGRIAGVLLLAAALAAVVGLARVMLGRRAAQITAGVVVAAAVIGVVLWAVVRVVDAA
jgi:hypothetical protein